MKPKILFYDLETMFNVAPVWGLRDQNISHDQIMSHSYIVCACWKFLGEKKVYKSFVDLSNPQDDSGVILDLIDAFNDADIVVTHNGNSFDNKVLNTRCAKHGLQPLDLKKPSVDTYRQALAAFKLPSYKLDFIGEFFNVGRKIKTDFSLWTGCYNGEKKALRDMVKYNVQDVLLLEDVYKAMKPYMKTHPNMNMFAEGDGFKCPKCLSSNVQRQGKRVTVTQTYHRYQCQDCGSWSQDKTNSTPHDKKKRLLK